MRIAIIQKNYEDANRARVTLTRAVHRCWVFSNRAPLMHVLNRITMDWLIVDWHANDCYGVDLTRWVKREGRSPLPVIFFTTQAESDDVASAYAAGASDYLLKPMNDRGLAERVFVQLRRAYHNQFTTEGFTVGRYWIDPVKQRMIYKDRDVELTTTEFGIAACLLGNLGRALSRDYIQECASGDSLSTSSRSLDSQISTIRIKLRLMPERGFQLRAVYGYGYRLDHAEVDTAAPDKRVRLIDWSMISTSF